MSRISEIMVRQLPLQHMLTARRTIEFFKEYADFMGNTIGSIESQIEASGFFPSSGPIVCFHNIDLEALDVEIGFVVPQLIKAGGDIQAATLPARMVAITIDRGPYEKQDPTLEELMKWIPENGYETAGGIYYHYLNSEKQPETEYLTEMYIPIKKPAL